MQARGTRSGRTSICMQTDRMHCGGKHEQGGDAARDAEGALRQGGCEGEGEADAQGGDAARDAEGALGMGQY